MPSPFARRLAVVAICAAAAGCAAPTSHTTAAPLTIPEPEEQEVELDLEITSVTLRRGSLRVAGTMGNGAPDVSIWTDSTCPRRELGHGIATSSEFAWSFSSEDVARAFECGLVVRARGRDAEGHRVRRIAKRPVAIVLESENDDVARLVRQETEGPTTQLSFSLNVPATRLHASGLVVGEEPRDDDGRLEDGRFAADFQVPSADLARAAVMQRPLSIAGVGFAATIMVGSAGLDLELPPPVLVVESDSDR